jgi:hypothetical protein
MVCSDPEFSTVTILFAGCFFPPFFFCSRRWREEICQRQLGPLLVFFPISFKVVRIPTKRQEREKEEIRNKKKSQNTVIQIVACQCLRENKICASLMTFKKF